MADINEVEAEVAKDEEAVAVPIFKKNGKPYLGLDGKQSTISVLGAESQKYQRARDELTRRLMRTQGRKMSPRDFRDSRVDQAVAAVVGWSGWDAGGKEWVFTPEGVRALLAKDHILTQVERGIDEHADFFDPSSAS